MKTYQIKYGGMICASAEAEKEKYFVLKDKKDSNCLWLIADTLEPADKIYVGYPYDTKSEGFAGRWLTFKLTNGEEIKLQGPWHSNSDSLYKSTGYDIRDRYKTFVVIGKKIYYGGYGKDEMSDIVYIDKQPTIGYYNRGDKLAKELANELKEPVYLHCKSNGGSHSCWVYPDGTNNKDWEQKKLRKYHKMIRKETE